MHVISLLRQTLSWFALAIFAVLVLAQPVNAQSTTGSGIAQKASAASPVISSDLSKSTVDILGRLRGTLQSADQALTRKGNRDADLAELSSQASGVRTEALQLEEKLIPLVSQLDEQLKELGPKPAEGELEESQEIQQKRKELEAEFSRLDGETKAMRLIAVRALQVERKIISNRRAQFVFDITKYSHSLVDPNLWQRLYGGFEGFFTRFELLVNESFSVMRSTIDKTPSLLFIFSIGLAVVLAIAILLQRWANRREEAILLLQIGKEGNRPACIRLAGVYLIDKGLIPVLSIFAIYYLFAGLGLFTPRLDIFVFDSILLINGIIIAVALAQIFLSPDNTTNRLALLSDSAAKALYFTFSGVVAVVAVLRFLASLAIAIVSPFEVVIGLNAILALTVFIGAIGVLILVGMDQPEDPIISTNKSSNFIRWGFLNPVIWLTSIVGLAALLAGYIALGEFIAWQIIIAGYIFATLWIGLEIFNQHRDKFLHRQSGRWRKVTRATGLSKQTVLQSGVFIFGIARLTIIVLTAIVLMIPWGYRTGDWVQLVTGLFFGFKIGGLTISISSIALAVLLFGIGYFVTRAIQNWLRTQFLPTTSLDAGLRNSIATIFGYAGIVLAALLGITAAGLNLSNVAIVAGALSVGIGFGLQSIVNNFVSGLILLAERPIKSGDWIITSGGQGTVRKTSVRSTEIETFDGATVIIPNSILITEPVTNWTHHDKVGRIIISIGVGYDSDPDQVRELLLSCIDSQEGILADPTPKVYFIDFGADALIFELRAYLKDINNSLSVKSGLRFAILRCLRAANVEIPYPQRDIHLKSMPAEMRQLGVLSAKPKTTKAKSTPTKEKTKTTRRRRPLRKDNEEPDD